MNVEVDRRALVGCEIQLLWMRVWKVVKHRLFIVELTIEEAMLCLYDPGHSYDGKYLVAVI